MDFKKVNLQDIAPIHGILKNHVWQTIIAQKVGDVNFINHLISSMKNQPNYIHLNVSI